jgi:ABC-2 type transport system ATP-binding protein
MLEIQGLTKWYNKKTLAADHVSFTVPNGCISVLVGPNGAGKSTLLKSVMGLLRYDGTVLVNGQLNKTPEGRALLGYVPEMPALYPMLTVREHLEFIARAYKLMNWEAAADRLLERFDLTDKQNKLGSELSKGMQQKVSICTALLPRPQIVLFDEPLIGLDPLAIKEVKLIFQELKAQNCSLLVSTHILDSVSDIWDHAYIMQTGRLIAALERQRLEAAGKTLEQAFFELTMTHPDELKAPPTQNGGPTT